MSGKAMVTGILAILARLGLGGVFIYAAWSKIQDPALFFEAVKGYDMLPVELAGLVAVVLPMAELVAGLTLVFTKWSREAALAIFVMMVVFLVGLTQAAVRGLDISCGCFGDSGETGTSSLVGTILRDLLFLVPAVWLAFFRGNGWIWQKWQRPGQVAAVLAMMAALALGGTARAAEESATNAVPAVAAEQWTTNFPAALKQAQAQRRPLLLLGGSSKCKLCTRTEDHFDNDVFRRWAQGSGIYLVNFHFNETNGVPHLDAAGRFLMSLPFKEQRGIPYVGIYWPQGTNELRTAFTFHRSVDLGHDHVSLMGKFILVVDDILSDYFKQVKGRESLEQILAATAKRIAVACDGKGTVTMEPEDGKLESGQRVKLTAKPGRKAKFAGWRGPNGRLLANGRSKSLTLYYDKTAAGIYTAVFEER